MLPNSVRFLLLGPNLGAGLGLTQALVAAVVWLVHGQPDFYFRGWQGVLVTSVTLLAGGAIVGIPFGAVVTVGEFWLSRRVRVAPALIGVVLATAMATGVMVEIEFARRELFPIFTLPALAVAIAGALLPAFSQPEKPKRLSEWSSLSP